MCSLERVDGTAEDYRELLERKRSHPDEFERWRTPALWERRLGLKGQVDVPMHLLFLGAVQGITGFVHSWLRKHGKFSNFMRLAQDRLTPLGKLRLSWLKILPYKGDRLGGWVSENYVGFARISQWFYLILNDLKEDEDPYKDPGTPQQGWKAAENRAWLKARGLCYQGLAKDLKERVAEYISKDDIPPILPGPRVTMEDLHLLIQSMYEMVKSIMVFEVNDVIIRNADFRIKRFLTLLVDCDRKINPDAKVPFWISSYTYPCLLNLPDNMRRYGPLKNLWEGSARGEGGIREFKPLHDSVGLQKGWAVQILKRVYQKKALRAIGTTIPGIEVDKENDESDDNNPAFYSHARDSYWKYPNPRDVFYDYREGKPMCLVFDGENYGAIIRDGTVVRFLRDVTNREPVTIRGMVFQSWSPDTDSKVATIGGLVLLKDFIVVHSFVLLPLPTHNPHPLSNPSLALYLALRDDYTMMDVSGYFT
jgi:hypothetical protein